jgi:hypothetical protein
MKISIPDPYTTSLVAAMYYTAHVQYNDRLRCLFSEVEKEKKSPRYKIQPSESIGKNIDTYA